MRLEVTYTPYDTSLKEQTGNVITFAHFDEGNIWTETCNDAESIDESDNGSIMMSEQNIENIDSSDESDHDHMTFVMEVIPIWMLTKGKHVIKYAILLGKSNRNGKDS